MFHVIKNRALPQKRNMRLKLLEKQQQVASPGKLASHKVWESRFDVVIYISLVCDKSGVPDVVGCNAFKVVSRKSPTRSISSVV